MSDAPAMKRCPYCAEDIRAEAIRCRYCGSDLRQPIPPPPGTPPKSHKKRQPTNRLILTLWVVVIGTAAFSIGWLGYTVAIDRLLGSANQSDSTATSAPALAVATRFATPIPTNTLLPTDTPTLTSTPTITDTPAPSNTPTITFTPSITPAPTITSDPRTLYESIDVRDLVTHVTQYADWLGLS